MPGWFSEQGGISSATWKPWPAGARVSVVCFGKLCPTPGSRQRGSATPGKRGENQTGPSKGRLTNFYVLQLLHPMGLGQAGARSFCPLCWCVRMVVPVALEIEEESVFCYLHPTSCMDNLFGFYFLCSNFGLAVHLQKLAVPHSSPGGTWHLPGLHPPHLQEKGPTHRFRP